MDFWFSELSPSDWWKKNDEIDKTIERRFSGLHKKAAAGELWAWRDSAEGRLAEIILLDQFSRNLFRGDPRSFAKTLWLWFWLKNV